MFRFLVGVLVGAGVYWAWETFGRDLLGIGPEPATAPYSGAGQSERYGAMTGSTYTAGTVAAESLTGSGATTTLSSPSASTAIATPPPNANGSSGE